MSRRYVSRRHVLLEVLAILFWGLATLALVLGIIHHALDLDDVRQATEEQQP